MELGTGIFLSALFLGTVALYIATRDRWRWKRIVCWGAGTALSLAALGGAAGYVWWNLEQRIPASDEFADVRLGTAAADVLFKRGEPGERESASGSDYWTYKVNGGYPEAERGSITIKFTEGRVRRVLYIGDSTYSPSLHSAPNMGATQERIEERLGKPAHISNSKDGLARIVAYPDKRIVYYLQQNRVVGMGIFDPSDGAPKFRDEAQ